MPLTDKRENKLKFRNKLMECADIQSLTSKDRPERHILRRRTNAILNPFITTPSQGPKRKTSTNKGSTFGTRLTFFQPWQASTQTSFKVDIKKIEHHYRLGTCPIAICVLVQCKYGWDGTLLQHTEQCDVWHGWPAYFAAHAHVRARGTTARSDWLLTSLTAEYDLNKLSAQTFSVNI